MVGNVIVEPRCMGDCHGPELSIRSVGPMDGSMDQHASCYRSDRADGTLCCRVLMVGPRSGMIGMKLELLKREVKAEPSSETNFFTMTP